MFFHLQTVHKKIVAMGYTSMYNKHASLALKAKMISSLAFVPFLHIDNYTDVLCADIPEELAELLNLFKDNYNGRPNRCGNSKRSLLFSPEV